MTLEKAFEVYQQRLSIRDDDDMDMGHVSSALEPRWWPLFKAGDDYLMVQCAATPQAQSSLYKISMCLDITFAYDNVESMLETVSAGYASGVYPNDVVVDLDEETRQEAHLFLQYNPQRTAWWVSKVPGAHRVEDLVKALWQPDENLDTFLSTRTEVLNHFLGNVP